MPESPDFCPRSTATATGVTAREPNFFAIGKCLADGRGIHRPPPPWQRPCSGRSGPPDDQPSPSCSSILFPSGRRAIPRWPTAQFEQPATTNSALSLRLSKRCCPSRPCRSAAQCAPQQRLYFRPEPQGQGSLRPTVRPNAGGSRMEPGATPAALPDLQGLGPAIQIAHEFRDFPGRQPVELVLNTNYALLPSC